MTLAGTHHDDPRVAAFVATNLGVRVEPRWSTVACQSVCKGRSLILLFFYTWSILEQTSKRVPSCLAVVSPANTACHRVSGLLLMQACITKS